MSNMKPAGYLNKFTGNIWNPEQQPGAEDEPETYEPLVRLSDVHGLVAENASMLKLLTDVSDNHTEFFNESEDGMYACLPLDYISEINMHVSRDVNAENPFECTDAAIAEMRNEWMAQGVDEFAISEDAKVAYARYASKMAEEFAANLRAGRKCNIPPAGWSCTRAGGHDGPCAAVEDVSHE